MDNNGNHTFEDKDENKLNYSIKKDLQKDITKSTLKVRIYPKNDIKDFVDVAMDMNLADTYKSEKAKGEYEQNKILYKPSFSDCDGNELINN